MNVGATLSKEYEIPYIVEYNGSEIEMKRSFDQGGFRYENYLLKCEMAAFKQATAINVISQVVADELIKRGIPKEKILVNPNGADPDLYRPVSTAVKSEFRQLYGWNETHTVIGFIGTFGGWHGIEVLAAALPRVCAAVPNARFLLIGDGNFRHLIDEAVAQHNLQDKVSLTGSLPQAEAIPYLKMCDIYVAPHSCHMKNQPFFGSPTKLFEYMALGGGIVASDLMQIGDVLRPAVFANDINTCREVTNEMAVLCEPGNIDQFVNSVIFLCEHPEISRQLGANARKELVANYTWQQHVDRLLAFLNKADPSEYMLGSLNTQILKNSGAPEKNSGNELLVTNLDMHQSAQTDAYKEQTQQQWNKDPCGSHYVKDSKAHTLEWYIEVERYRYQE
jgi:glycosyltransferase involved in cell wall biosynthesis